MRRIVIAISAVVILAALTAPALANPGQLSEGAAIYAGGEQFRTKDAADLPEPSGNNAHSFDAIHPFVGLAHPGQLSVAEAAPGEPGFNGGRWAVRRVQWTDAGLAAMGGTPSLVTSSGDLYDLIAAGYVEYVDPQPIRYFLCPLVPVR